MCPLQYILSFNKICFLLWFLLPFTFDILIIKISHTDPYSAFICTKQVRHNQFFIGTTFFWGRGIEDYFLFSIITKWLMFFLGCLRYHSFKLSIKSIPSKVRELAFFLSYWTLVSYYAILHNNENFRWCSLLLSDLFCWTTLLYQTHEHRFRGLAMYNKLFIGINGFRNNDPQFPIITWSEI